MPPSAHPASSTIVLPPITAFDYPSRNAPAPAPFAPSPYTYTAYQPHLHSLPAPPPPNQPGHGGFTTTRPIWPGQSYVPHPGRIAPPMTADPNLLLAQTVDRANFKEVKRRTKTGCQTCRKRRIKCDETKPACRNCLKSKRVCLGYDPTPQGAANSSPSLHQPLPRSHTTEQQSYRPPVGQPEPYNFHRTPSLSSRTSSAATDNSFAPPEFSSPANSTLPPIRADSPPRMEDTSGADDGETGRYQSSESDQTIRRAKRCTIDELCTVGSTQRPVLPPLQPNQIPDLHRIKAIYATAFAPGLDKLLETLWFSKYGFQYLVNFEGFLAQILAYIQLISDHQQGHGTDAALASQEARVTWALLGLCVRPQAQTPHLRCLKGRLHAISVMLTGDGVPPNGTTVYEDESDPYIDIIAETESSRESHAPSVLEKQLRKRSHEFWRAVGRIVNASWNHLVRTQKSPEELDAVDNEIEAALGDCQARLDGRENRDVVYSVLLMRYLSDKWTSEIEVDVEMEGDAPLGNRQIAHQGLEERIGVIKEARKRWNVARRLLEGEAGGRSTSLVLGVVAGMAVRAWA